jgi:hypothetical protein
MPTRWRIISLLLIATLFAALTLSALPTRGDARVAAAPLAQDCSSVVENGGFEIDFGWDFDPSPAPPLYVNTVARSENRALQLGVSGANVAAASTARQRISIPPTATSAILDFWYYPIVEASPGADSFQFSVFSADGLTLLQGPWTLPVGFEWWQPAAFDFSLWRGQTFQLVFTVNNDGVGGRTLVFLDDVSLLACSFAPVSPSPWPTFTPTSIPWPTPPPTVWPSPPASSCVDVLQNGGFDSGLFGWTPGNNPLRPSVVASPVFSPPNAVELGSTIQNLNAFSSVRQTVTMPPGFARTFIGFRVYTWAESLDGADRQQFVLLGPGNVVWATPWKVLENAQTWQQHLYEVIGAPGPTFDVYFAAVNDGVGGRTALYVDDVSVWACPAGAMPFINAAPLMEPAPLMQATPPVAFDSGMTTEVIPLTPDPSSFTPVDAFGATAVPDQPLPTPIMVPFSGLPGESRIIANPTLLPQGTPEDVTGIPTPGWTEVAIAGQSLVSPTPLVAIEVGPTGTPPPPQEARGVATAAVNPETLLTRVADVAETVAPSPTRLPFGLLAGIQERTAQWPQGWPWVLLIIVLVVVALIFLLRRSNRNNYNNPN